MMRSATSRGRSSVITCAPGSSTSRRAPGTLIGVYPDPDITDVEVFLGQGDAIVLYTDGVSEEPDPVHGGETMLDVVLRECIDMPADRMAQRIEEAAVERQQGSSRDDIAILVVRIEP